MGRHRRAPGAYVIGDPARAANRSWWPWLIPAGGLVLWPVGAAVALLAAVGLVLLVAILRRRRAKGAIRLSGAAAREYAVAAGALGEIRRCWPSLGGMAEPVDIGPTLERTAYQLARLLAARARRAEAVAELRAAREGLGGADGELFAELDERLGVAVDRLRELDAQFAARSFALARLAGSLRGHEHRERVRALLVAAPEPEFEAGPDPLAEVGARIEATLTAYRELCEIPRLPSET